MGPPLTPALEPGFDQYHASSSWDFANPSAPGPFMDGSGGYSGGYPDGTILERRRNLNGGRHNLATMATLDPALFDATAWSPDISSGMTEMSESVGYFSSPMGGPGCAGSASVSPTAGSTVWSTGIPGMNMAYLGGPSDGLPPTDTGAPNFNDDGHYAGAGGVEVFDTTYYQMPAMEGSHGTYGGAVHEGPKGEISKSGHQARGGNSIKSSSSGKGKSLVASKEGPPVLPKTERKRKSVPGQDAQPVPLPGTKLRTASRQRPSEAGQRQKPGESPEHQLARATHNKVEKAYRNRLNDEYEQLADVLSPPTEAARLSKADVVGSSAVEIESLAGKMIRLREKKRQKDEKRKRSGFVSG